MNWGIYMKIKTFFKALVLVFTLNMATSFAAPHWTHHEQSEWGAIEDTHQTVVPLMYPFAECSIGKHQSPIDLAAETNAARLNILRIRYDADTPVFYNSGHGVQVNTSLDYNGRLKIGKLTYPLIQFHFHEPSEHVIHGQTFPAELHFVHVRDDGKLAVLGVLIETGKENPTFQTILNNMPYEEGKKNQNTGISINPKSLLPRNTRDYYAVAGSLTTPPCSEGVEWYVLAEPIVISEQQLEQLKSFYSENARMPQDLNGRVVSTEGRH